MASENAGLLGPTKPKPKAHPAAESSRYSYGVSLHPTHLNYHRPATAATATSAANQFAHTRAENIRETIGLHADKRVYYGPARVALGVLLAVCVVVWIAGKVTNALAGAAVGDGENVCVYLLTHTRRYPHPQRRGSRFTRACWLTACGPTWCGC